MKLIAILLLIIPAILSAQYSPKEIDSLMTYETARLRKSAQYEEIISLSKKMIQASQKINYPKGEAWAYAHQGNALSTLGHFKESLESLQKAKKIATTLDDNALNAAIAIEIGRNYSESQNSFPQAISQFKSAIELAKKIPDTYDKETYLLYAYQALGTTYINMNKPDSAIVYLWKSKKIEEDPFTLVNIAYHYTYYVKNKDSLKYYLDESTAFLKQFPTYTFERTILSNLWGKYYENLKDYKKAIVYFEEGKKLGKETSSYSEILESLNGLARCHEKLGEYELANEYMKNYAVLKDSLFNARNKNVTNSIENIVKTKEENLQKQSSNNQKILISVILITIIIILVLVFTMMKHRKKKNEIQNLVEEKETLLHQKEQEAQILHQKINESFEEVVQLAKDNSPQFWNRFTEVYPNFSPKMLLINPDLKVSELTQLAYIYLGFNIKEMSTYTFKSEKTIKNYRFNLRSKLNLSREDHLMSWIQTYINE